VPGNRGEQHRPARSTRPEPEYAPQLDQPPFHAGETEPARCAMRDSVTVVRDSQLNALRIDAYRHLDASRLGMADHVRYGFLAYAQERALVSRRLWDVAVEIQLQRQFPRHHQGQETRDGGRQPVLLEQRTRQHLRSRCQAALSDCAIRLIEETICVTLSCSSRASR